jgi:hypothetical protein
MSTPTTKTIEITVSPEGSVSVKTNGFSGSSCRDATRELERALGLSSRETLLPEFHAYGQAETRIQQGQ